MPVERENIEIRRKKSKKSSAKSSFTPAEQAKTGFGTNKVIAITLFIISILVFLSLVSYSPKDEANTQVTFIEFVGIFTGDEAVHARMETTYNWLGLLGAIISDYLINSTFGYLILAFPVASIWWLKFIYLLQKPSTNAIKYTAYYLTISLMLASLMASFRDMRWLPEIPKEMSGAIGDFIFSVISAIIGTLGSIFVLIASITVTTIMTFKIRMDFVEEKIDGLLKRNKEDSETESIQDPETITESEKQVTLVDYDENPAKVIKSNFDYKNKSSDEILKSNNPEIEIKGKYTNPQSEIKKDNPFKGLSYKDMEQKNDEIEIKSEPHQSKPNTGKPELEKDNIREEYPEIENDPIGSEDESPVFDEEKFDSKSSYGVETADDTLDSEENDNEYDYLTDDIGEEKKLIVTVNELEEEEPDFNSPLSTAIHDEKISYTPPTLEILVEGDGLNAVEDDELRENARILQEKLETFKINIENLTVTPGPVVTQYEFVPAAGIKISKIESLVDDLAMALKARGIRIIAPIPGKGTVGIEIPNSNPSLVTFKSLVLSKQFKEDKYKLPVALGKTISGEVMMADLTRMPHLLMAGSTGSGKSVGINTIIASLLYKKHPSELKFIIIDPKKVELQHYKSLKNHFLAASHDIKDTIITDPGDAVLVLKSAVAEMEQRYDILSKVGQRNISDYNHKIRSGTMKDKSMDHRPMPYIVVIVDELADLMITASKEIEEPIIRLAQMARAVGIHLILATQRPSVDVITGIIKANFPARISYLVASRIDSRTILDVQGAEKLLGYGDMLFLPPGMPKPLRLQNSFISTDEVDSICEAIGKQRGYSQPYFLPSLVEKGEKGNIAAGDRDPLFEEAARLIVNTQQGSVSLIQRRLKVGYARAGRIIDELEDAGVVGPFDGSKARVVLMESESELERIL